MLLAVDRLCCVSGCAVLCCAVLCCAVLQIGHDYPGANLAAGRVNKVSREGGQSVCVGGGAVSLRRGRSACVGVWVLRLWIKLCIHLWASSLLVEPAQVLTLQPIQQNARGTHLTSVIGEIGGCWSPSASSVVIR